MLILSLLRLKSVSSHPSPAGGAGAGLLGLLGIKAGGAFSWSLRCSSCRTSSVFSLGNSPGTGVTLTTLREAIQSHIRITSESNFRVPNPTILCKRSDTVVRVCVHILTPRWQQFALCFVVVVCVCLWGGPYLFQIFPSHKAHFLLSPSLSCCSQILTLTATPEEGRRKKEN